MGEMSWPRERFNQQQPMGHNKSEKWITWIEYASVQSSRIFAEAAAARKRPQEKISPSKACPRASRLFSVPSSNSYRHYLPHQSRSSSVKPGSGYSERVCDSLLESKALLPTSGAIKTTETFKTGQRWRGGSMSAGVSRNKHVDIYAVTCWRCSREVQLSAIGQDPPVVRSARLSW